MKIKSVKDPQEQQWVKSNVTKNYLKSKLNCEKFGLLWVKEKIKEKEHLNNFQ